MAFRTQKISQMTPKGSDLEATDLIEVSTIESGSYVTRSITGQELIDAIPAPSVDWGDIGGTLSDQTDLNTALSGKVPTTRTLTINGTTQDLSADRTFTISTGITIGTTAIASGTVGRVLFEGTGNVVQESANLFWDNTNGRLGIGISSPSTTFAIGSGGINRVNLGIQAFEMYTPSSVRTVFLGYSSTSGQLIISSGGSNDVNFLGGGFKSISTGNFAIGSTTDAGFKLDVNGTARMGTLRFLNTSDTLEFANTLVRIRRVANAMYLDAFNGFTFFDSTSSVDRVRITQDGNVGIGTSSPAYKLDVNGDTKTLGLLTAYGISTNLSDMAIYNTTNNTGYIRFITQTSSAQAERMRIANTGNLLINTTTDAGFRLDVNGTARVTGTGTSTANSFVVQNSASVQTFRVNDLGQVQIGRTTAINWTFSSNNLTSSQYAYILSSNGSALSTSGNGGVLGNDTGAKICDQGLGGANQLASAVLECNSTTRGFLPPRMTTTQKNTIATPAAGLQIYDTTLNRPCFYDGTTWITL